MFYTIPHLEIPQDVIFNKPLWHFDMNNQEGIRKTFKQLKDLTGYRFDDMNIEWSNIFGHLFSISVHLEEHNKTWMISVWDHTGTTSICRMNQEYKDKDTDVLSQKNYQKLQQETEDFVRGYIKCSDCKTKIRKTEIAGSYFAGRYCTDCWEGKWKAIEAKETYE